MTAGYMPTPSTAGPSPMSAGKSGIPALRGGVHIALTIKWDKDRVKEPQRTKEDYPKFGGRDENTTDFNGGLEFEGERFND
jgi:hypothetical protein